MTGATNILALEGLETVDVIQALERYASRHGIPAVIFVDNGTQLKTLSQAKFSLESADRQVQDMGMRILESNPKSCEERGRVERRIRMICDTLIKVGTSEHTPMTTLQWENLFSKVVNALDNLPIAKGNATSTGSLGLEIITASRIKLGRNNFRSLGGDGIHIDLNQDAAKLLENNRLIYNFWYQMYIDSIHQLLIRPSKWEKTG